MKLTNGIAVYDLDPAAATADLLAEIDGQSENALDAFDHSSRLTPELFNRMGKDHFFVSTTTTLRLFVLEPESERYDVFAQARAEAISRGALFAMIAPTWRLADRLRKKWKFEEAEPFDEMVRRFEQFRQDIVARLEMMGVERAEQVAFARMQRFEYHEFPLTPAGWTVSLYGHRHQPRQAPQVRLLVRGLFHDLDNLLVWPVADGRFAHWMTAFVRRVLDERAREITVRPEFGMENRERLESEFIKHFKARLKGDPDPTS